MFPVGSPNYHMLSLYSRQLPKADIQSTIFCLFVTFVPLWCHCNKRRREWKASHMTTLRSFTGRVMRGYLTFNKQYKQKNEQHIMIISWVTEIHAEKFSLPCNITKWVLHLYNLSAPLRCASSVRFSQRWCRLGRWKFLKTQKPQFKVSLVLLCFYSLKFLLLNSTNNNRNSSKQI